MIGLGSDKKDKTFTFVRVGLRGRRTLVVMFFVIGKKYSESFLNFQNIFFSWIGFSNLPLNNRFK